MWHTTHPHVHMTHYTSTWHTTVHDMWTSTWHTTHPHDTLHIQWHMYTSSVSCGCTHPHDTLHIHMTHVYMCHVDDTLHIHVHMWHTVHMTHYTSTWHMCSVTHVHMCSVSCGCVVYTSTWHTTHPHVVCHVDVYMCHVDPHVQCVHVDSVSWHTTQCVIPIHDTLVCHDTCPVCTHVDVYIHMTHYTCGCVVCHVDV